MPLIKEYRLFISHGWKETDDYTRFVKILDSAFNFKWWNETILTHDPSLDPDDSEDRIKLDEILKRYIQVSNGVILLSGIYEENKYWIQSEIKIAKFFNKAILAIKPQKGDTVPKIIQENAWEILTWNSDVITQAIKQWAF